MITQKNKETICSELAASTRGGSVQIYGQTLEEVCLFYKVSIQKTRSRDFRAFEQARYAIFILEQIGNFTPRQHALRLQQAVALFDSAISVLSETAGKECRSFDEPVRLFAAYRRTAAGWLEKIRS